MRGDRDDPEYDIMCCANLLWKWSMIRMDGMWQSTKYCNLILLS